MELDESSETASPVISWPFPRPPFPSCLAGFSSIPPQPGRATGSIEGAVIPQLVVNDLVTWVGEKILPVQGPVVCSKARDLLKIRAPWAELATNLELCSAGDAALATALTTIDGPGPERVDTTTW